ncbi:TPA: hypothetical protein QIE23_000937 [Morganella morganii subsp. morganii]|nr:hypothetical protein [Morganella morganii subsp. morganii]HDU8711422.1 hypothetical protein [Morganella morganii subsp. morganii]
MATIIDALIVSLRLDNSGFSNEAKKSTAENNKLSASVENVTNASADLTITIKNLGNETKKATKKQDDFTKSVNEGVKAVGALFSAILVSSGLAKLISEVNRANDQLYFLSKNLGMSATEIKKWQNMAEMSGGSADGMAASMSNLSKSLWDLVTIGDSSVLPYFNALNVGVVDSGGKLRDLDAILLDVADSLSGMSRPQAYNIAKNMGFDEGTINTLLQGRDAMQEMLDTQRGLVISSEEELEISRQLNKQNAQVRQGWEGLKTLLANYLMPTLLKFSEVITGVLMFLNKNRDTAVMVFKGIGIVLGVLLIPLVIKAAAAFLGLFASIGLVPLALFALGAGLWLLYDDYKKWKEGGESLLGEYWAKWDKTITYILMKLDQFERWFKGTTIGQWFTDQEGNLNKLEAAFAAFAAYIATKWAAKMLGAFGRVSRGATKVGKGLSKGFIGKAGGVATATYIGSELADYALNEAFGDFDWFQRARTAQTWGDFGKAIIGEGDARWVDGEWVDNRGKQNGARLTENTLDIPTGDPERDTLAAKVSKGELSLDEANDILMNGYDISSDTDGEDGSVARNHTERGLRYNSPLNLAYANQQGADNIGGWAKFDTEYNGIRASANQLKMYYDGTSRAAGYQKLQTVWDIIHKWAPKGHGKNDPVAYSNTVASGMGVGVHDKINLNDPSVMYDLMKEMSKMENKGKFPYSKGLVMSAINGTGDPAVNLANKINSFNDFISNPIAPNAAAGTRQIMANSQMLQSGNKTVNNRVEANFGDININTSSATVSGNVADATTSARENMFQLITPMS